MRPPRSNALEGLVHSAAQLLLPFIDPPRWRGRRRERERLLLLPDGRPVEYTLVRRRRRTIGFTIDARGLTVSAPQWVSLAAIGEALDEKRDWIARKLDDWQTYEQRRAALAQAWCHGGEIRYLGRRCRLQRVPADAEAAYEPGELLDTLHLPSRDDDLRSSAESWLRARAFELLDARVAHFAAASGLHPRAWRISSARTLWGSCSSQGIIRLNWRLIQLPAELIDYVVVHELAHLRELNHSARFWATVEKILPGHELARKRLRDMPEHLSGC
ncbi:MAG: SprT family zinc-dependent metalloprotease [Burkholderiaceae bacterium]